MSDRVVLPEFLRSCFWDDDFASLDWDRHRSFLIGRILTVGSWEAVCWVRKLAGDETIRQWILSHQGGALTPRQLRFWELILALPPDEVDRWLAQEPRRLWQQRIRA